MEVQQHKKTVCMCVCVCVCVAHLIMGVAAMHHKTYVRVKSTMKL